MTNTKSTPEVIALKEAIGNAEKELREHLVTCLISRGSGEELDGNREATANLCEAYLDEWHTYRQLRKGEGEVNGLPHPVNPS